MDALFAELDDNGITSLIGWEKRFMIGENAHLVCNVQMYADGKHEEALTMAKYVFYNRIRFLLFFITYDFFSKIGTTKRGIGPTYSSKCFRNGIRVGDLVGNFDRFVEK